MPKNIITIATGKKLYIDLAVNLYHSFIYWNRLNDIQFYLVTDYADLVKPICYDKLHLIAIEPGELGVGFSTKLHLDKLAPYGQTLFIDADCLIFEDLLPLFKDFKGRHVSVVGNYIINGKWFGDVESILKKFRLNKMPKFNGGIYYLEKGSIATSVYTKAREIEKEYDQIGWIRLRNQPNDEVIMALAMEFHHQKPLIDDGTILSDPQACQGGYYIDIINGKRCLHNPPKPNPLNQTWYPFEKVAPTIIHFLGCFTEHYPYQRECYRLKKALSEKLNWQAEFKAKVMIEWPGKYKTSLKNFLRPFYRILFGIRKIRPSKRIAQWM